MEHVNSAQYTPEVKSILHNHISSTLYANTITAHLNSLFGKMEHVLTNASFTMVPMLRDNVSTFQDKKVTMPSLRSSIC